MGINSIPKKQNGLNIDLYPKLKTLADEIISDKKISSRSKNIHYESNKILHEKVVSYNFFAYI